MDNIVFQIVQLKFFQRKNKHCILESSYKNLTLLNWLKSYHESN